MCEWTCQQGFTVYIKVALLVYFRKKFKVLTLFTVNEGAQWHFRLPTATNLVNAGFLLWSSWKSPCLSGGEKSRWPSTDRSCWSHIIPWHFRCDICPLAMLPWASPGRKGIVFLTSLLSLVIRIKTGRHPRVYQCTNFTGYYILSQENIDLGVCIYNCIIISSTFAVQEVKLFKANLCLCLCK